MIKNLKNIIFCFLLIFCLNSKLSYASENPEKTSIEKRIEENNEKRRESITRLIESKLNVFEQKETFVWLTDDQKILFFESLKIELEKQIKDIVNKNKKEVFEIFLISVEKRLEIYSEVETEEKALFLELFNNE